MPVRKPQPIRPGDIVAMSIAADATRFEVVSLHGMHGLYVREPRSPGMDRDYASQYADVLQVARHWPKAEG
jgi:hypothetical protein